MRWASILAGVLFFSLACGGGEPPDYAEYTFLSHRDCGRDASYPSLTLLTPDDEDPSGAPTEWWTLLGSSDIRWGRRSTVRLRYDRNNVTQHTSVTVDTVLEEVETPGLEFRMRACGATFLEPSGRALMDGKAFDCAPNVCAALDARIAAGQHERFDLVFRFSSDVDGPLQLLAVEDRTCDDSLDCPARDRCCAPGVCKPFQECDVRL